MNRRRPSVATRRRRWAAAIVATLPCFANAADRSPLSAPLTTPFVDSAAVLTAPLHWDRGDAAWAAGSLGLIGGSIFMDRSVQRRLFPIHSFDKARDLQHYGDAAQWAPPVVGGLFLGEGLAAGRSYDAESGYLVIETWGLASGVSGMLKLGFGRKQPYKTDNPFSFSVGHNDYAFPSGHTVSSFALATTLAMRYPRWEVAVPAYGAATMVGVSRLYANKHWASDVVAGAILGIAVSRAVCLRHGDEDSAAGSLTFTGNGLQWARRF